MIGTHSTAIIKESGVLKVILHSTIIYSEQDGIITLNNGGYITQVTVKRMNQSLAAFGYCHILVYRRRGIMYVKNIKTGYVKEFNECHNCCIINIQDKNWR